MTAWPWWRDAVVYQIYPRSFADSNGDGVGDLLGIIDKLDHIADLGVDTIWLSPIFRSPMADFGYDVADYCEIDPIFGTNDDLIELLDQLHQRDIRLILDWVPNHTSDQHPWFVESRSSLNNPKRDWYVWRDRTADGSPPNNWTATFKGVPAWTHDALTDQSYMHMFLAEQPDLNWSNPDVEAAMHETLRFWLDLGVDGFRADVVHLIGKGDKVDDLDERSARIPIINIDRPFGHELLRRVRTLLDSYPKQPMIVGEVVLFEPGQTASYLGGSAPGEAELHLSFDFRSLHSEWTATAWARSIDASQRDFAEPRWPTWVLSNHDQPRHRSRFGTEERARAAAIVSMTVRGTPFLYAGEELGLEDAVVPDERIVDPDGRDGCRAPIPWMADGDDTTGHGWSASPWLPFPANAATHNAQQDSPASMLALYRRLLALRRTHDCLRRGAMSEVSVSGDTIRFDRSLDDERLTTIVNFGSEPTEVDDEFSTAHLVVGSVAERRDLAEPLAPDEAVVISTVGRD